MPLLALKPPSTAPGRPGVSLSLCWVYLSRSYNSRCRLHVDRVPVQLYSYWYALYALYGCGGNAAHLVSPVAN